jgi:hypothetical protein
MATFTFIDWNHITDARGYCDCHGRFSLYSRTTSYVFTTADGSRIWSNKDHVQCFDCKAIFKVPARGHNVTRNYPTASAI